MMQSNDVTVSLPIYSEIKPTVFEVSAFSGNQKFLAKEHSESNPLEKKEIEYWQITTKEAVKFRPCTETFIKREWDDKSSMM